MENSLNALTESFRNIMDSDPLFFLDYDGTLVDIRMNPEDATADDRLLSDLEELGRSYELYIVTGRSMNDIMDFIGYDFNIIALHGALARINGVYFENVENFSKFRKKCDDLYDMRESFIGRYPGLRMYNKNGNILFHFGLMEEEKVGDLIAEVRSISEKDGMDVYLGKMIVELRIPGMNKGIAIRKIRGERPSVIAGDDKTDEDAFRMNPDALKIKVGNGETLADFKLRSPGEMRTFIEGVLRIRR